MKKEKTLSGWPRKRQLERAENARKHKKDYKPPMRTKKKPGPKPKPKKIINSRAKGKRGELDLVHFLKERGIHARRGQQFSGGSDSPDVIVGGCLTDIHIEVKNAEQGNIYKWLDQACADADICKTPVVMHKRNGRRWVAILDLRDFLNIMQQKDVEDAALIHS